MLATSLSTDILIIISKIVEKNTVESLAFAKKTSKNDTIYGIQL